MKPKDKPTTVPNDSIEEPKLFIVVDDEKFPRPGLETSFIDYSEINENSTDLSGCLCYPVSTNICGCNKVKPVCNCVGHTSCSCDSHTSGGGTRTGCRCAPVH